MTELKDYWVDKQSLRDIAYCDMYTYIFKRIIAGYDLREIEYKPLNIVYVDTLNKKECSNTTIQILDLEHVSLMAQELDRNSLNIIKLDAIAIIIKQLINANLIDILKYRKMSSLTLTTLAYTIYSKLLYTDFFVDIGSGFKQYRQLIGSGEHIAPSYVDLNNEVCCVKYHTFQGSGNKDSREFRLAQRLAQGYIVVTTNRKATAHELMNKYLK